MGLSLALVLFSSLIPFAGIGEHVDAGDERPHDGDPLADLRTLLAARDVPSLRANAETANGATDAETVEPVALSASAPAPPGLTLPTPSTGATLAALEEGLDGELVAHAGPVSATVGVQASDGSIGALGITARATVNGLLSLDGEVVHIEVPFDLSRLFDTVLPEVAVHVDAPRAPEAPPSPAGAPASTAGIAAPPPSADGGPALGVAAAAAALAALAVVQSEGVSGLRRFFPILPLYARIPRERVLEHATRERVYALLRARPGLSLEDVADTLALSRSTARHHLRTLEEAGLLRHAVEGRCRIHFPAGRESEAMRSHVLDHPQRARIFAMVRVRPLSLVELSAALEANVGSVHFHLRKLSEAGLIERVENGSVRYAPK